MTGSFIAPRSTCHTLSLPQPGYTKNGVVLLSLFTFKSNLNFQSRERDKIFHTFSWRKYRCGVAIKSTSISIQMSPIHYFYQFKPLKKYTCGIETHLYPQCSRGSKKIPTETVYSHALPICVTDSCVYVSQITTIFTPSSQISKVIYPPIF